MKNVLVVGGSSGIGKATAERLIRDGVHVMVAGRRKDKLESVTGAIALQCDVADAAQRATLLTRALAFGPLDGMVYAAGVAHHQLPGSIDDGALNDQIAINLIAPLRLGESAIASMAPGGAIVFIASTLARYAIASSMVYSATKAAMLRIAEALAIAGRDRNIRVNTLLPGLVATAMLDAPRPGGPIDTTRALKPEQVADAVVDLLRAPVTGTQRTIEP